jgi:hypothetical protein
MVYRPEKCLFLVCKIVNSTLLFGIGKIMLFEQIDNFSFLVMLIQKLHVDVFFR